MKTLEQRTIRTAPENNDPHPTILTPVGGDISMTFFDKVERVAPWLAAACLEGSLELDTRGNQVHAYVEAHYVTGNSAL